MTRERPNWSEMDDPSKRVYDETNSVRFRWHIRDVQHLRPDLTDAEAFMVLHKAWSKADHSDFWDEMAYWCGVLFPKHDE